MFKKFNLLNGEPDAANAGTGTPASQGTPANTGTPAPAPSSGPTPAPASSGLDFVPEAYRNDPSLSKYKTADEFFKGYQNLQKLVGQKEIVQVNGIQIPKEDAPQEEWDQYYNSLGRPESADKYEFSGEIKLHEGLNFEEEKEAVSKIAHTLGLSKKQAEGVFKAYAERSNTFFQKSQDQVIKNLNDALVEAFGKDGSQSNFEMAKRGAKALDGADKINLEDVINPVALKALAKLGEYVGEDSFEKGGNSSVDDLLKQAKELQMSEAYQRGDKAVYEQVTALYKQAYPN